MSNLVSFFLRALLALSLLASAPAAMAGPTYRVSLDTQALAGITGYLSLGLNGVLENPATVARVGNFSGVFLDDPVLSGDTSGDVVNGIVLRNGPDLNFVDQMVTFGGLFSFDVGFDYGAGDNISAFTVAFLDEAFDYLGGVVNVVEIDIAAGEFGGVVLVESAFASVQEVAEVPEPGEWLLLATGLFLIGATRRMQQRR